MKSIHILVVDDETFFAEWLAENLRDASDRYEAHWVNSGERALEFMEQQPADLVISDIKMAGISGIELLNQIRARHPGTGVILMTGYALPELEQEAVKRGSLLYLEKPFLMEKLQAAIEQALTARESKTGARRWSLVAGEKAEDRGSSVADRESFIQNPQSTIHNPKSSDQRLSDEEQRSLRELLAASDHLEGGALITIDGDILASTLPEALLTPTAAADACALFQMCQRSSERLGRGNYRQSFIQGDLGNVIITEVGVKTEDRGLKIEDREKIENRESRVVNRAPDGFDPRSSLFLLFVTNAKATLGLALLQARQRAQKVSILDFGLPILD